MTEHLATRTAAVSAAKLERERAPLLSRVVNSDHFVGYLFISPLLVGLAVWTVYPLLASLYLSFTQGALLGKVTWVGLANYQRMFTDDELFVYAIRNTAYYVFASVVPATVLPLLLALALNQKLRGIVFFRFVLFLPTITSSVALSVMWLWIYNPQFGIINQVLDSLGVLRLLGMSRPAWLADPRTAMLSIIIMAVWRGLGYNMLLFLAALQDVPEAYYEAAKIDGADAFARLLHVTLPLISPMVFFVIVMGIIGGFQVFEYSYVMTGGQGGPVNSTLTMVLYLYREGFVKFRVGYASALAYVLFLIIMIVTIIQLRIQKWWVFYQ
jgi:multiple sugar transport system permease protein